MASGASLSHLTDGEREAQAELRGWQKQDLCQAGWRPLPGWQLLLSSASNMPSGQAQVNLGE